MRCRALSAVMMTALLAAPAAAQQSDGTTSTASTGPDAAAATTTPPAPDADRSFVDKAKDWAEETQMVERLSGDIDGWYPRLGGMTRGGGFAIGPGYRTHLGNVLVDLSAGISIKSYKSADVKVRWLNAFDGRVELWTNYRFEDFPQEDFFGMGPDSSLDARTSYDFDSSEVTVLAHVKPLQWFHVGTEIGYMSPEIGPGTDRDYPSTELLFADAEAPGLFEQPNFLHSTFFAEIDYRDAPNRPRDGGYYRVSFGIWDDRTLQQYDFRRFDVIATQWVPLDNDKAHVVLGRFGASYANNEREQRVPFYFLPYVGGVDTVRSLREFRFKDENALWMTAEYNWSPMKYFTLAGFLDAGTVSADWQDIHTVEMKYGYGFGIRAHTSRMTLARLDFAAGGGEGWQMFLKLAPSF